MRQMRTNEVAGGQCRQQRKLASHDGSRNDACQSPSVLSRLCGMCSLDAKHVQHGLLRRKDGATAYGANLE
jgi:hypothetical protein